MAISEISEVTPESVGFSGGSKEIVAVNGQNHALLSSIPSFPASSHSTYPNKKQHGNRYSNISKPQVCFGGNVLAQKLISRLVDPERYRKWLGLWAMGGAGKTFTARKIYNDGRIRQHFTGGRYWVTVSKDRKSIGGIHILSKEILGCVVGKGSFSFEDARALLKSRLDKDKVLLVLDDVWDPHTLEHLDLISNGRNGVILVTTRDDNNLKTVMDSNDIFQIPPLSDEDSWKLFSWHAFSAYGNDIPPDLEKVAKDVADECVGLPLPLQVIGSAMVGKSLRQEWEDALKKLRAAYVAHDEYETITS